MSAYLLGFASPFVGGAVVWLVMAYAENVSTTRMWEREPHAACGFRHMHRPWLPWRAMKAIVIPATNWRCAHGAQVPLWIGHGSGRANLRSNTSQAAQMRRGTA